MSAISYHFSSLDNLNKFDYQLIFVVYKKKTWEILRNLVLISMATSR